MWWPLLEDSVLLIRPHQARLSLFHLCCCHNALVYSGCSNKYTINWVLINKKHLFLTVLGAGKSKVMVPADLMSGESFLMHSCLLSVSSHGRRGEELCEVSFIRALIPFMRAPPSSPNHAPNPLLLIPSHWALGFEMWILGRYGIQSIVCNHHSLLGLHSWGQALPPAQFREPWHAVCHAQNPQWFSVASNNEFQNYVWKNKTMLHTLASIVF